MMTNRKIAKMFETIADMLAIRGDHFHRVQAYRRAAENIRELNRDLNQLYLENKLTEIPGIGATLATKIEEILTTGQLEFYDRLADEIPPSLTNVLRIEGLGPKRVKQIYDNLGITTVADMSRAAESGKLGELPGLGKKTEERILKGIRSLVEHGDQGTPLGVALPIAEKILEELEQLDGVLKTAVAGSLRRRRETIGDIDLLIAAIDPKPIMSFFCQMQNVETVLGSGSTKSSVVLLNGMQVDLRVLPADRWGTLLSYFTGSKAHNVRLRELAIKRGLSLNEHAFTPIDGSDPLLCQNEQQIYETLDMPYIPPVLREDRGEIEAALRNDLPNLVGANDIRADLHVHSNWSDGRMSILEMAKAAKMRGLEYMVISDHSVSLGIANGLSVARLSQQTEEIRDVNEELGPGFRVFHGTELEIRADGTLDYPDNILSRLDFVIASLHVSLRQPRGQIMDRLFQAVENPHVDMIAHPTGRLIPDRQGADIDMEAFLVAAARTNTIVEINANPQRLDLKDIYVRRAIDLGIKLAINSDAHHADHFDFMHYGIAVAQRGWAPASVIVNTWPVETFQSYIRHSSRS